VLPPAVTAGGGHGGWRVSVGVGIAGGGSVCWGGRREREAPTCYFSAAGVGRTGDGRVGRGGALVCCRRRF